MSWKTKTIECIIDTKIRSVNIFNVYKTNSKILVQNKHQQF